MPNTRRTFLQSAALAAGIARAGSSAAAAEVPKMKFGNTEISRLVVGCNPFYGFAHFNNILGTVMREYYTSERVCEVLHQCNRFGINALAFHDGGRAQQD